jgi:rhodanese-related sulfurtransferase
MTSLLFLVYIRNNNLKAKLKPLYGVEVVMKTKTVEQLKQMLDNKEDFQLIDVREEHEFEICNLNAELIPMGEIPDNVDKISKDKPVVVHCRSGKRSGNVIQYLESNFGFTNLYNLEGGILAWADEIDDSMPKY